MFFAFIALLVLNIIMAVVVWVCWSRITAHMRADPEAAKAVAEHVVAALLKGKPEEREAIS